jgi:Na+/melibiose symporter-like transporter
VGTLTSIVAAVGLTFALHEAPSLGWTDPTVLIPLIAAVIATVVFIVWELHTPSPLLDVRHFRSRSLSSGTTLLLVLFGVQGGVSLVLYPFFQVVLGWGGLLSTLALMPMAVLMMLASGLAPRLATRIGPRATMVAGLIIATTGLALMASLVSAEGGYLTVLPGLIAMGLGAGVAMTPSTEAITSSLPREHQGVASALNDLTRELGAALGIALLGGVLVAGYQTTIAGLLTGVPERLAAPAREGIANASALSQDAGGYADQILAAANQAFVAGWQQAMWVGVAVMSVLVVYVAFRGPSRGSEPDLHSATPESRG